MKSGVYKILNLINGKVYIGSAVDIKSRWVAHTRNLNRGTHHSCHLQRAWDSYGFINFKFEVIEYYKKSKLLEREQYYLDFYNSANPNFGYNICSSATSRIGTHPSEDTRKKMLETRKRMKEEGKVFGFKKGHTTSDETREKISRSQKGKPSPNKGKSVSEESRKKMSDAKKGKPSRNKGKSPSDDTRKKMSDAKKNISDDTRKKMSDAKKGKHTSLEATAKMLVTKREKGLIR